MDPVSPLAIASFSLAVLGFLISNIPVVIEAGSIAKNHERVIRRHYTRLSDCLESLRGWDSMWRGGRGQNRRSDRLLKIFWGQSGFQTIVLMLKNVRESYQGIDNLMKLRKMVAQPAGTRRVWGAGERKKLQKSQRFVRPALATAEEGFIDDRQIDNWLGFDETDYSATSRYTPAQMNVIRRLVFGFCEDKKLEGLIDKLWRETVGLWSYAKTRYAAMGHIPYGDPVPNDHVSRLEKLVLLGQFSSAFYENCLKTRRTYDWAIEMRLPTADAESRFWTLVDEAHLEFFVQKRPPSRQTWRISIWRLEEPPNSGTIPLESVSGDEIVLSGHGLDVQHEGIAYRVESIAGPRRSKPSLRTTLMALEDPHHPEWDTFLSKKQLDFAMCSTLWFVFLWETKWFTHFCSCCIHHFLTTPSEHASGVSHKEARRYVFQPWVLRLERHECHDVCAVGNELLLLASFHGEILYGASIRLQSTGDGFQFVLEKTGPNGEDETKKKQDLLSEARKEFGWRFSEALEYCIARRGLGGNTTDPPYTQVKEVIKRVLVPLVHGPRLKKS